MDKAIKKKEILPFTTTQMDLEDIMLSKISQTQTQILYDLTYMWNLKKKKKLIEKEIRFVVTRGEGCGVGESDEDGQKAQTFNYKINKHWRYNLKHDDCS